MKKNFNLTEEEKIQILEMHKSHGYRKPIMEQYKYEGEDHEYDEKVGEGNHLESVFFTEIEELFNVIFKIEKKLKDEYHVGNQDNSNYFEERKKLFDILIEKIEQQKNYN
jgi:hypothetical protein